METFLALLWLGKEMGRDSPLAIMVRRSWMVEEVLKFLCKSDTKSMYSPWRIAFQVFSLTWAAMSPGFERGVASGCWTKFWSQKSTVASTVKRPACCSGVLATVAILFSTIAETIVVIWSMVIGGWDSLSGSLLLSLAFGIAISAGSRDFFGEIASVVRFEVAFHHYFSLCANTPFYFLTILFLSGLITQTLDNSNLSSFPLCSVQCIGSQL